MKTSLKVGLAGFMTANFPGEKEKRYKAFSDELEKYASRLGYEFIPFPKGIYHMEDARAASREFSSRGVHFLLLHAASFADAALIKPFLSLEDTILGIWSAPEEPSKTGALQYNALCLGNLLMSSIKYYWDSYNKPVKWFYGFPENPLFYKRFYVTIKALKAYYTLKEANIALIGGRAKGFDNLYVDERRLFRKLGVSLYHREFDELHYLAKAIPEEDVNRVMAEIKKTAVYVEKGMEQDLESQARVVLASKIMAEEGGYDALALSCWPKFQAYMDCAVCTAVGHLNERGIPVACEGDVLSASSMLALHSITQKPVTLMDMVDVDEGDESILFWHCGPTAPSLAGKNGASIASLSMLSDEKRSRGTANNLTLKKGEATIMGYTPDLNKMIVMKGSINPDKPTNTGSGGWMESIRLCDEEISVRDIMETVFSSGYIHHYPLAYGELDLPCLELAAWQGIEPVRPCAYKDYLTRP